MPAVVRLIATNKLRCYTPERIDMKVIQELAFIVSTMFVGWIALVLMFSI